MTCYYRYCLQILTIISVRVVLAMHGIVFSEFFLNALICIVDGSYFSFSRLVRSWRAAASNERITNERVTDSWRHNYSLAWLQITRLHESSYVDIVNKQEPVLFFHLVSPNFVYEILKIHDNVAYIPKVLLLFNLLFYFHLGAMTKGINYFVDFSKVTLTANVYIVMNTVFKKCRFLSFVFI